MAIRALKPVGVRVLATKTYMAGGRIPFGAAVIRAGTDTVKAAILENTDLVIGFAMDDGLEHLYDGFYEQYEPVKVAIAGTANALVTAIDNTSLLNGDFLEVIDVTSGTMASSHGVLGEAGSAAGETRTVHVCAKLLEDVTLTSAVYAHPATQVEILDTSITVASGAPTTMGLSVGDYIFLTDADGTTAQINRVTTLSATVIGLEIPAALVVATATDYLYAIRQAEVLILP